MTFTKEHGPVIAVLGEKMVRNPSAVSMIAVQSDFEVMTNEGLLRGKAGDYLAYDELSGHVWPVSEEYVGMHYTSVAGAWQG